MNYELRDYQGMAVDAIVSRIKNPRSGGSIVSLPTGAGKSLVIAASVDRLGLPAIIVCPSQEILKQNKEKLLAYVPKENVGVYSASMNEKTIKKYTLITIQSAYKKPELFTLFGVVMVDECDLYPPDEGMFRTFLNGMYINSGRVPPVIGFTATPFRMVSDTTYYRGGFTIETSIKMLTDGPFWKDIIFNIDNWPLVKQRHITPLKVIEEIPLIPFEQIPQSSGDFALKQYAWAITRKENEIIRAVERAKTSYKSILVFVATVEQAERLSQMVYGSAVVSAKTKPKDRIALIDDFKSNRIKVVFNVGVLTCGFDHPSLDCVILARPTKSLRLFYQMLGRAVRTAPNKLYGTVIDLTGSTKFLGRIESIKIKQLENCHWGLFTSEGRMDGKVLYTYQKET